MGPLGPWSPWDHGKRAMGPLGPWAPWDFIPGFSTRFYTRFHTRFLYQVVIPGARPGWPGPWARAGPLGPGPGCQNVSYGTIGKA